MTSLSLPDSSALESLVTTAIYDSLITARLSPTTNPPVVRVTSVAPLRDIRPQTVTKMISVLSEWEGRCGDVIGGIEAEIAKIKAEAEKNRMRERERTARVERSVAGNGDKDDAAGGVGFSGAGGSSSGHHVRSKGSGGSKGSKPGTGNRGPFPGSGSSNKREFNATTGGEDGDGDDGYWEDDGGVDVGSHSSRMDIDEGAGASVRGSASGNGAGGAVRQAKRMLAMGKKS